MRDGLDLSYDRPNPEIKLDGQYIILNHFSLIDFLLGT